jgi:hypothetical protein
MLGFRGKIKSFISTNSSDQLCSPTSLLLNGHRKSFTRVKRLEHEVDNSLVSNVGVRKEYSYNSTVPYTLVASTGTALTSPFDYIYSRKNKNTNLYFLQTRGFTFLS